MHGLMMERALTISSLIEHAAKFHKNTEIVSRTVEGPIHRYTYGEAYRRVNQLANVLTNLGVSEGDRVGTLAWNGYRHFELYFAVSGMGSICHTINPRLFPEQITYIINHANDKVIFCDLTFVPVLESLAEQLVDVNAIVIMTDREHMPETQLSNIYCYEELMDSTTDEFEWPEIDELQASSLCYSSGTTGSPKGVLYSHRSTVLHSFAVCSADGLAISGRDTVLPVVPMFHVNAWGMPYASTMAGAKLVFPGGAMDGKSLAELLIDEKVTFTGGVPTVWLMLLQHLKETGKTLPHLQRTVVGGSALPQSMIETFENDYDVACIHAWGMTEMSPLGTVGHMTHALLEDQDTDLMRYKVKQGRVLYGVDMKIVNDDGTPLPQDGKAFGELCVRGPWVTNGYFEDDATSASSFDNENWFRTGDVATIDPHGYMEVVDRSKDVIKSGGEWISSIELENIAIGHAAVAEAAVIGIEHEKWGERPLLVCVKADDINASGEEILSIYEGKVAQWCIPNAVEFLDELPHTATGKLQKLTLREHFKGYRFAD